MAFDARHGGDLLRVLRAFLYQGGNKAGTATELGLSRPTLYARLAQIEGILKVDLERAESRLSLHVASLALDASQVESMFRSGWASNAGVVSYRHLPSRRRTNSGTTSQSPLVDHVRMPCRAVGRVSKATEARASGCGCHSPTSRPCDVHHFPGLD
jgi:hypothetical protein